MECFICGNKDNFTALSPDLCATNNWLCGQCGLVFIPRERGGIAAYYKEDGYYTRSPNLGARRLLTSRHLLFNIARKRVEGIEQLAGRRFAGLTVLDVGCGYGENLGFLQARRNCSVLGLEPSPATAQAGSEFFRVSILPAILEEHDFGGKLFDLVICSHTLEHVEDPRAFLAGLRRRVAPGGLLYIEVPNVMWPSGGFTLEAFLYDEHIQTFSRSNLAALLGECGFGIEAWSDRDFLRFVCNAERRDKVDAPKAVAPAEIERFLRSYKQSYSAAQHVRVYAGKLAYLTRLSYSKLVDLVQR